MKVFSKPFTQQEAIAEDAIAAANEVMRSGRLHRYNAQPGEMSEASLLEQEYSAYQGSKFCIACTSGGTALQIALRVAGAAPGTRVLANAYTLAPVPGAIHATGAHPVFVDIDQNYHIDIEDLRRKASKAESRILLLSHMRGHIADMDAVLSVCDEFGLTLIEDCAHTMGARWNGTRSGNFGSIACFSTQTYKHMNSGEGGFITTDDPEFAARAVLHTGSYMLYDRHGAIPDNTVFDDVKLECANFSSRMDNLRAAILRPQLKTLDENIRRWNDRYSVLEQRLRAAPGIWVPERRQSEFFVGSSIQFRPEALSAEDIPGFIGRCGKRGVELKWFGENEPRGYTSRYDSWQYLENQPPLAGTLQALEKTCDMRIPLTFSEEDCGLIADIIAEEVLVAA